MIGPGYEPNPPARLTWRGVGIAGAALALLVGLATALSMSEAAPLGVALSEARQLYAAGPLPSASQTPLVTVLLQPFTRIPLAPAAGLLATLLCALGLATLVLPSVLLADPPSRHPRPALVPAALVLLAPLATAAWGGSFALLAAFLLVASWTLVERRQDLPAGAALGLGLALHPAAVLLLAFYAIKQRWKLIATAAAAAALFAIVFPLLAFGWNNGITQLQRHLEAQRAALGNALQWETSAAVAPSRWGIAELLPPAADRWQPAPPTATDPTDSPTATSPAARVSVGWTLARALLCLVAVLAPLLVALTAAAPWPPPTARGIQGVQAQFGAILLAIALLSGPLAPGVLLFASWAVVWLSTQRLNLPKPRGVRRAVLDALLLLWLLGGLAVALPALYLPAAGLVVAALTLLKLLLAGFVRPRQGEGMIAAA